MAPDERTLAVLEMLELPYAILGADGVRRRVSSSFQEAIAHSPCVRDFWFRVTEMVRARLSRPDVTTEATRPTSRVPPKLRGLLEGATPSSPRSYRMPCGDNAFIVSVHSLSASDGMLALVLLHPRPVGFAPAAAWAVARLTNRELHVARLLATGMAIKQIGATLGISAHTARHHTESIYDKLGVDNRVAVALTLGGAGPGGAEVTAGPVVRSA